MPIIDKPGIYDITSPVYHADPCPVPSLSASIAKVLDDKSPLHAWAGHPRLGMTEDEDEGDAKRFDLGTAAHAVILGSDDEIVLLDPERFPSKTGSIPKGYTNDAIREARDAAYDAGKTPVLPKQMTQVKGMASSVLAQLERNPEMKGWREDGKPEQTLIWEEGGVWCRSRLDWMPNDSRRVFLDLKTTETNVNPEVISRYAMQMQWAIQQAFYTRGLKALGITDKPKFRFVAVESKPPYAVTVCGLPPEWISFAEGQVESAIRLWRKCMEANDWPGYPYDTVWIEPPAWAFTRIQERGLRDPMFKPKPSSGALSQAAKAQAPLDRR